MSSKPDQPLRMPSTGTDYTDGDHTKYIWPHPFWQREGGLVEEFWSVTEVLNIMSDFSEAMQYWQAQHVVELVELAKQRKTYTKWDDDAKTMIEANPIELLSDLQWLKGAGYRQLGRAAARGTVVHAVIEEWVYKFVGGNETVDYTDESTVKTYTQETIDDERRRRGSFFVEWDECWLYVQQALRWLDQHVKRVHMAETAVFNRSLGYAGTVDLDVELKNADGLWRIDAKTSSSHYDSHRIQLAAYDNAELAAVGHGQILEPLPRPDRVANLYIGTDNARLREWWVDKKEVPQPEERLKDFTTFCSLLKVIRPRVKPQKGEDGKFHAINPVTVERCTNRAPKRAGESKNE